MSDNITEQKPATKEDQWGEWFAEQERSGLSVKQFCKARGLSEWSFYTRRKRLRQAGLVRFALVETRKTGGGGTEASLELMLVNGERLRIGAGVDRATLRMVVEVLRA
jgi:hypothetical protein